MLYRVSLTGKHDRFSVPQLGYLGYRVGSNRSNGRVGRVFKSRPRLQISMPPLLPSCSARPAVLLLRLAFAKVLFEFLHFEDEFSGRVLPLFASQRDMLAGPESGGVSPQEIGLLVLIIPQA